MISIMQSTNMDELFLSAVLDRFEGDRAILKLQDGQEWRWPRQNLPKTAKEGSVLFLRALQSAEKEEEREKLAKTILNEILNP